jgi:glucokinase
MEDEHLDETSGHPRLVGDIGGTNARFAWIESPGASLADIATLPCADYATLQDAMERYIAGLQRGVPRWAAIGIANPVLGDQVRMTNHHWSFSIEAVRRQLGLERFLVVNDFTALALSLPALDPADLRKVGSGAPVPGEPLGLLGAGTGLGVSGLLPASQGARPIAITGEGGHVTLAAVDEREEAVARRLRVRFGHASAERALSGPGLVNLYEAVCQEQGGAPLALDPAGITSRAAAGQDAACSTTLELFFAFLGTTAGNLALSLGARGGMYIGGGIVPRLGQLIDRSPFRERFEAKGRFRAYLQAIPTFVLQAGVSPALIGASRALDDL